MVILTATILAMKQTTTNSLFYHTMNNLFIKKYANYIFIW